jgi:rubredoxin
MNTTMYWMCESCGHCTSDLQPPEKCPHCDAKCSFRDVTCYRPECGGPGNIDPLLAGQCQGLTHNNQYSINMR